MSYDDKLRAHAVHRIGFRMICSECGPGDRRKQKSLADAEAKWHRADHEDGKVKRKRARAHAYH